MKQERWLWGLKLRQLLSEESGWSDTATEVSLGLKGSQASAGD